MPKQSTRFYRKNEAEVMKELGLNPTKNSGSGWVEKADGQNEYILCELKSTEKASISVKFADIAKLEEQAIVAGKLPVFAIQDLTNNETFVIIRPENIVDIERYLRTGKSNTMALTDNNVVKYAINNNYVKPKKKIGAPRPDELNANKYIREDKKAYE